MNTSINSYKDLIVWQKSMDLVVYVYELARAFPTEERFGLSSQMQRAAVSIPSNIAEGSRRGAKEFKHFLTIAFGSASELETQIDIAKRLNYGQQPDQTKAMNMLEEVLKMLNTLLARL